MIVSKFPPLGETDGRSGMARALDESLRSGVIYALQACVGARKIGAFGASVYGPEDARALLDLPGLAALQLPLSLANMAAADSGVLEQAARHGSAIFARSVFLQGLLIGEPDALDPFLAATAAVLATLRGMSGVRLIVVGVDSVPQLAETLAAYATPVDRDTIAAAFAIGRGFPPDLIDPRRWNC